MTFPWLVPSANPSNGPARRLAAAQRELRERAALLARLGLTVGAATARLAARVAWEHERPGAGGHARPAGLDDDAIAALVAEVYVSKRF